MGQTKEEKIAFYDEFFLNHPGKWSGVAGIRTDSFAYSTLKPYLKSGIEFLDLGCGNGHTIEFFKSMNPDINYTGVDISPVALKLAGWTNKDIKFFQEIPEGSKYDIITCIGVAEHEDDPALFMKEIAKHLTRNGVIYLVAPDSLAMFGETKEGWRKPWAPEAKQEEWMWRRETWEKAIGKSGLRISASIDGPEPGAGFVWVLKK